MSQKLDKFHKYLNLYEKLVKKNAGNFVDEKTAEDVVQDTFLKMYENLDYLQDEKVKPWLIIVSGNIAKDYRKKGGHYDVQSISPEDMAEYMEQSYESAEKCYERECEKQAASRLCETACDLLHEKNPVWYEVILDTYFLEMSSAQIGDKLGISKGNVDVIKHRARTYLRRKLGKEYQELF